MKKNQNIIEELEDSDEEVKKNTSKNVKIGHEALNEEENSNDNFQKYISTKNFFLKIDEERLLIINYSNKLIKILNSQQDLSTSLKSSVLSYFRRFFFFFNVNYR